VLLSLAGFVSGMTIRIAEPMLPRVAERFDVGVGRASVLIWGFAIAYGAFQILHGPLGDRIGKLRAVTIATMVCAVTNVLCTAAPTLPLLAGARFLAGMAAGAVIPLSLAYVGDTVAFEERQAALARYLVGTLTGQIAGPLVGGVFGDLVGWRATFLVPAGAFLAIGLLLMPTARRQPRPPRGAGSLNPLRGYGPLLRRRHVRIVLLATLLEGILFMGTFSYLGAYLRHDFGLGYTPIGLVLATYGLGGLTYAMVARRLIARLGQRGLVLAGGAVIAPSFLVLAVTPVWGLFVPALATLAVGFYMLHTTLQTRATELAPETRGAGVSAFVFCIFGGQTIGTSILGALVAPVGYRVPIVVAAAGIWLLTLWFAARLPELERARRA
jgi:predicted MFS family arabinose efflux permease